MCQVFMSGFPHNSTQKPVRRLVVEMNLFNIAHSRELGEIRSPPVTWGQATIGTSHTINGEAEKRLALPIR
jgi:hypothetical protein